MPAENIYRTRLAVITKRKMNYGQREGFVTSNVFSFAVTIRKLKNELRSKLSSSGNIEYIRNFVRKYRNDWTEDANFKKSFLANHLSSFEDYVNIFIANAKKEIDLIERTTCYAIYE